MPQLLLTNTLQIVIVLSFLVLPAQSARKSDLKRNTRCLRYPSSHVQRGLVIFACISSITYRLIN